jgi:hypothetical protein
MEGLIAGLEDHVFLAGNTSMKRATMQLRVELPSLLKVRGWQLRFQGLTSNRFVLGPLKDGRDCRDEARDLLRCLDVPGQKVRDVVVTRVSIDVCMDNDCC